MASEIKNSGIPMDFVRMAVTRTLKSRIEEVKRCASAPNRSRAAGA